MRLRLIRIALFGPLAAAAAVMPSAAIPATPPAIETAAVSEIVAGAEFGPQITVHDAVDIAGIEPSRDSEGRVLGTGIASYYGKAFAGRPTASGERFNPQHLTAAHRTLPFGSKVRVTNPRNGKWVVVRINDRGPFIRGRTIDLSRAAAEQIDIVRRGHGQVELALID
jgi:rare lipoprotein A